MRATLAHPALCILGCVAALLASPVQAAPDRASALHVFDEARALCERDDGALWGRRCAGRA